MAPPSPPARATCRDVIAALADEVEATPGASAGAGRQAHVADCAECRAYLATYRRTTRAVAGAAPIAMPDRVRRRLRSFLRQQRDGRRGRRGGAREIRAITRPRHTPC